MSGEKTKSTPSLIRKDLVGDMNSNIHQQQDPQQEEPPLMAKLDVQVNSHPITDECLLVEHREMETNVSTEDRY